MKNDSRDVSGYSERSEAKRFADAVEIMMAAFRDAGNRMKRMCEVPSSKRVRNLRAWSASKEFRPRGCLYRSFFACCAEIGFAHACDGKLLARFKRKLDWFCDRLAEHLCYGHGDTVAKFSTLIESLADVAEDGRPLDVRKERTRLSRMGEKVFYELSILVKAREIQLRVPVKPTSLIEGSQKAPPGREGVKQKLRMLVHRIMADRKDIRKINDAVDCIRFAKKGDSYFPYARQLNAEMDQYGWSITTIRQYAKDIGRDRTSRRGARAQAAKRRKRRLVDSDTLSSCPPR